MIEWWCRTVVVTLQDSARTMKLSWPVALRPPLPHVGLYFLLNSNHQPTAFLNEGYNVCIDQKQKLVARAIRPITTSPQSLLLHAAGAIPIVGLSLTPPSRIAS